MLIERLKIALFLSLSALMSVIPLAFMAQSDQEIIQQELRERVEELDGVHQENEILTDLLDEANEREKNLKERNEALEEFFSSFLYTYDNAAMGRGHLMNVLSRSYFTADMLEHAWVVLRLPGMKGTGESLVYAEQQTGINAVALAALGWLESGGGQSAIARHKNNLFGYGAYDGYEYNNAYTFHSRGAGVIYVAEQLQRNYFSRGGRYYTGPSLVHANKYYASDPKWAAKIGKRMQEIVLAAVDADEIERLREDLYEFEQQITALNTSDAVRESLGMTKEQMSDDIKIARIPRGGRRFLSREASCYTCG